MTVSLTVAERRRVVSVRAWLEAQVSPVLHLCSEIMGEEVSIQQLVAVVSVCMGFVLALFAIGSYPLVGIMGIALMGVGAFNLKEGKVC